MGWSYDSWLIGKGKANIEPNKNEHAQHSIKLPAGGQKEEVARYRNCRHQKLAALKLSCWPRLFVYLFFFTGFVEISG
jgi:hypothetical protein